jgi:2-oxoglutarate dehydrogenase E2 component (dihydrolipoamide succinyltransferase)
MSTDVIMPQMGESIFEGTLTKWLKKTGERVEKDEPLFEISTDKVDAEIPSPVAGVLAEIKVPEGATVQINCVVAVVSEDGSPAAVAAIAAPSPALAQALTQAAPQVPQVPVVMPQMGESITEGTITKWLKQAGERVEKDEPLFEISTDKVDAEIPSPVAGVLAEIKVPEGATVQINTVVALISESGSAAAVAAATVPPPAPTQALPKVAPLAAPQVVPQAPLADPQAGDGRLRPSPRSSPLVRRIAKENHLDLTRIAGTGAGGRITKEDVLSSLSGQGAEIAAPPASAPQAPLPAPEVPQMQQQVQPLTRMRAIIAQRMVESKQISPHVHTVYKVDMTRIVRLREREKARFEQQNGVKLTYMPFIAAAIVEALAKFPIVNASLRDGSIHYHRGIHLGIAVALEWGLIVPVVKNAEERSFLGLARAIADLASRARSKKLTPEEAEGSTFTLTNSGIFGDEFSMPIINQPNSAILSISGLNKEPVVLTDAEGNDTIAIRSMQHFCLGFDHRLIDGADACKFMSEFKRKLEGWDKQIG